jgi:hypothetical protein
MWRMSQSSHRIFAKPREAQRGAERSGSLVVTPAREGGGAWPVEGSRALRDFATARFGAPAAAFGTASSVLLAVAADPLLADGPLRNEEALRGQCAVVLRGAVSFVAKVRPDLPQPHGMRLVPSASDDTADRPTGAARASGGGGSCYFRQH